MTWAGNARCRRWTPAIGSSDDESVHDEAHVLGVERESLRQFADAKSVLGDVDGVQQLQGLAEHVVRRRTART